MIEAYRVMGASEEFLEAARKSMKREEEFEVFEDNLLSIKVFQDMDTQWDRAGMNGTRSGLKFEAAPVIMRMHGVKAAERAQVLHDLKVMERETLLVDNERRE